MNTLKRYYLGETSGSWGYIDSTGPVRLGTKHYATRICEERGVKCIDLTEVADESVAPVGRSAGFKDFLIAEFTQ